MSLENGSQKVIYQSCIFCSAPLGAESKDLGLMLCHKCRICKVCNLPLSPQDLKQSWADFQESRLSDLKACELSADPIDEFKSYLQHARCSSINRPLPPSGDVMVEVKQSYLDYLNLARLQNPYEKLCCPNDDLSIETNQMQAKLETQIIMDNFPREQKFLFLSRMEAIVAACSILLKKDRKLIKEDLDKREAKKFKEALNEANTSSRAVNKPANDVKEVILAEFMKANDIKDRAAGLKIMRLRNKAIEAYVTMGFTERQAQESVDKDMKSRGQLK